MQTPAAHLQGGQITRALSSGLFKQRATHARKGRGSKGNPAWWLHDDELVERSRPSVSCWLIEARKITAALRQLEHFPLTWNRTGPHPLPATPSVDCRGWPGGGAGRCRLNENRSSRHHAHTSAFVRFDSAPDLSTALTWQAHRQPDLTGIHHVKPFYHRDA
jgi:hypothetical protein